MWTLWSVVVVVVLLFPGTWQRWSQYVVDPTRGGNPGVDGVNMSSIAADDGWVLLDRPRVTLPQTF